MHFSAIELLLNTNAIFSLCCYCKLAITYDESIANTARKTITAVIVTMSLKRFSAV